MLSSSIIITTVIIITVITTIIITAVIITLIITVIIIIAPLSCIPPGIVTLQTTFKFIALQPTLIEVV